MIYGYSRVSTKSQAKDGNSLEAVLKAAGVQKIYSDAFTGTKSHRPELDKLLEVLQAGDTLIVTKLDRIARSAAQGTELIESLLQKRIIVHENLVVETGNNRYNVDKEGICKTHSHYRVNC